MIKSITIQNVDGLLAATDLWVYYIIGRKRFEVATFVSDICCSQLYVYGIEQINFVSDLWQVVSFLHGGCLR
jgi:hypothetical protein